MAMKKKPGRSKVEVGIPSTEAVFSAGNNNASGSLIANLATQNRAELAYELREIALQDIELNPDNAIFRQLDTDEDVETLANDIDRNGLMHNLVVYPRTDGKQTKYVLLSGERRYKALNYLQARGDAKWNTVKNCRVVTTPLSDNEKKVMLLSANLQVRGGFANEMIRRKAVAELVSCLQAEPYNLTAAEAKKAIKEATPINGRQIDKDLSIEKNLNEGLKDLLDRGFVLRSEAESFLPKCCSSSMLLRTTARAAQPFRTRKKQFAGGSWMHCGRWPTPAVCRMPTRRWSLRCSRSRRRWRI